MRLCTLYATAAGGTPATKAGPSPGPRGARGGGRPASTSYEPGRPSYRAGNAGESIYADSGDLQSGRTSSYTRVSKKFNRRLDEDDDDAVEQEDHDEVNEGYNDDLLGGL
ncbi:hypothetical protein FS837_010967 [Tulasnella sp. UAMH 9824]|nr:hypothetical protein FS837_010967 [Tulasnella sp. UAMH 9824]